MLSFDWGRVWHYDIMISWHSISNPHVVQSRGQRRPVEPHHLLRCHGRFAVGHWLRSGCGFHGCLGTVLCRYLRWIVVIHVLYDMHIQIQYIHIYIYSIYSYMNQWYLWEAYKDPISIDIITLCVTPLSYCEFEPPKRTMWRYGTQRVLHLVLQEHWTSSSDVVFPPRSWVCDHTLIQNDRCWWDMSWDGIQSWLSWPKSFILPFLCIGMYIYIYISICSI